MQKRNLDPPEAPALPPALSPDEAADSAIRARLGELVDRHTQAEIARRTDTTPSNVSRYLKGTRIPASFCTALVDAFRVNPTWLLTGQGSMHLDDVSEETARTAGNLSSLVQAMTNLAHTKLGGLLSRGHQKALWDLDQSFRAFERAKQELNERTRPVLEEFISEFERAITEQKWERAKALREVALQAARLCEDTQLKMRLDHWQGHLEYYTANWDAALDFIRRGALQFLLSGTTNEKLALDELYNYAMVAAEIDRIAEADRAVRMACIFAEAHPDSPKRIELQFLAGAIAARAGHLGEGMRQMLVAYPLLDPKESATLGVNFTMCMLLGGAMQLPEVLWRDRLGLAHDDLRSVQPLRARGALHFAAYRENANELRDACDIYTHKNVGGLATLLSINLPRARFLLSAIESPAAELLDEFFADADVQAATASSRPSPPIDVAISAAQIARLAGEKKLAERWLDESAARIAALPAAITLHPLLMARHCKNALYILPRTPRKPDRQRIREDAADFVRRYFANGFGCLADLLPRLDGA